MNALDSSVSVMTLDDNALSQRVTLLVRRERKHLVEFLRHLAEFDSRKLFLRLGHSSLYAYCRDALKLSDGSAFRRYAVARLLPRFPVIAEFLEDGRLNLKRLADLRDVLTAENHLDVLTRASVGTEQDVEILVATLKPKPDVKDSVRKVSTPTIASTSKRPEPAPAPELAASTRPSTSSTQVGLPATRGSAMAETSTQPAAPELSVGAAGTEPGPAVSDSLFTTSTVEVPAAPRARRMEVEATSATAFSVRMRVGPEFLAEFEAVKAELSHKFPDGNFEDILRECFRVTLDAVRRRRAVKTSRCDTSSTSADAIPPTQAKAPPTSETEPQRAEPSRYIPAAVRRAVWTRDGGRCAFVSADGKRCDSTHQLEVHHIKAFASGGASTTDNLSLRCRPHNAYEAELDFGAEFMRAKVSRKMRRSEGHKALPPWKLGGGESKAANDAAPGPEPTKLH